MKYYKALITFIDYTIIIIVTLLNILFFLVRRIFNFKLTFFLFLTFSKLLFELLSKKLFDFVRFFALVSLILYCAIITKAVSLFLLYFFFFKFLAYILSIFNLVYHLFYTFFLFYNFLFSLIFFKLFIFPLFFCIFKFHLIRDLLTFKMRLFNFRIKKFMEDFIRLMDQEFVPPGKFKKRGSKVPIFDTTDMNLTGSSRRQQDFFFFSELNSFFARSRSYLFHSFKVPGEGKLKPAKRSVANYPHLFRQNDRRVDLDFFNLNVLMLDEGGKRVKENLSDVRFLDPLHSPQFRLTKITDPWDISQHIGYLFLDPSSTSVLDTQVLMKRKRTFSKITNFALNFLGFTKPGFNFDRYDKRMDVAIWGVKNPKNRFFRSERNFAYDEYSSLTSDILIFYKKVLADWWSYYLGFKEHFKREFFIFYFYYLQAFFYAFYENIYLKTFSIISLTFSSFFFSFFNYLHLSPFIEVDYALFISLLEVAYFSPFDLEVFLENDDLFATFMKSFFYLIPDFSFFLFFLAFDQSIFFLPFLLYFLLLIPFLIISNFYHGLFSFPLVDYIFKHFLSFSTHATHVHVDKSTYFILLAFFLVYLNFLFFHWVYLRFHFVSFHLAPYRLSRIFTYYLPNKFYSSFSFFKKPKERMSNIYDVEDVNLLNLYLKRPQYNSMYAGMSKDQFLNFAFVPKGELHRFFKTEYTSDYTSYKFIASYQHFIFGILRRFFFLFLLTFFCFFTTYYFFAFFSIFL